MLGCSGAGWDASYIANALAAKRFHLRPEMDLITKGTNCTVALLVSTFFEVPGPIEGHAAEELYLLQVGFNVTHSVPPG